MTGYQQITSQVDTTRIAGERHSQRLVIAFVISGMLFMLLPGTFLGVWNLLSISQEHQPSSIPQAWLQAHGQAQIFGWIGSFILGIGFYSLTKMRGTKNFPARAGWIIWAVWTIGVLARWFAGVTGDAWRTALPLSGFLQLFAFVLFFLSVRRHRPESLQRKPEAWMRLVFLSTIAFMVALLVNCGLLLWQGLFGNSPALRHEIDQEFVVLSVWGVLVPTIWGFNARWLPIFLGLRQPRESMLYAAYGFSLAGVLATFLSLLPVATVAFLIATLLAIDALHVWTPSIAPPKLVNVDPRFPWFVRITYVWLLVSSIMGMMAVIWDSSGGIWGASRHAITVGYVAGMVFAIGQRVLPAFSGMRVLWSTRLMFWSQLLLFTGCLLRVAAEPLAYEHIWTPAWKILPISAIIELAAVSTFAVNLGVTLLQSPAYLRVQQASISRG
ncbi:MAG: NnrS family protein [Terracidiphilus sp.]